MSIHLITSPWPKRKSSLYVYCFHCYVGHTTEWCIACLVNFTEHKMISPSCSALPLSQHGMTWCLHLVYHLNQPSCIWKIQIAFFQNGFSPNGRTYAMHVPLPGSLMLHPLSQPAGRIEHPLPRQHDPRNRRVGHEEDWASQEHTHGHEA